MLWVAMSNFDMVKTINQAYSAGATTFLAKPLDGTDVRNLIDAFDEYWTISDSQPAALPFDPTRNFKVCRSNQGSGSYSRVIVSSRLSNTRATVVQVFSGSSDAQVLTTS